MDDLTKLTVDSFLDQLAERSPTPGGGGATGVAGALACALAHMVAAYSVGKKTEPAVRTQVEKAVSHLHHADQLLRALITQDATAYADMAEAARSRRLQPARTSAAQSTYADAVLASIAVPMEMAAVVSNALAAMDEFKELANRHLLSDLGIAAVLADATARAARYTVRVNVPELAEAAKRSRILTEIDGIAENCRRHCESIEAFVRGHLENDPADNR